jgi:hypothetical protein
MSVNDIRANVHPSVKLTLFQCNVGGQPTCEFGNKMWKGKMRVRGRVLDLTRTRDAGEIAARARARSRKGVTQSERASAKWAAGASHARKRKEKRVNRPICLTRTEGEYWAGLPDLNEARRGRIYMQMVRIE